MLSEIIGQPSLQGSSKDLSLEDPANEDLEMTIESYFNESQDL